MTTPAQDWTLSDDRRTLTIHTARDDGTSTITFGWDHPITASELDDALQSRILPNLRMLPGQSTTTRRYRVAGGTLWVSTMTGPPTWWVPRCQLRDGRVLVIGWLRRGWTIAWNRGWR